VNCPACGHVNQESAKFCSECATAMRNESVCPACGHENTPGSKFCSECAKPMAATAPSLVVSTESVTYEAAARTIVTAAG
jgi:uncharacterized membrane protein YvbJ